MTDQSPVKPISFPWRIATTRDVLAVLSTLIFFGAFILPWLHNMPVGPGASNYVGQIQGAIILQWGSVMSWYFGSSKQSAEKDDAMMSTFKKDNNTNPQP